MRELNLAMISSSLYVKLHIIFRLQRYQGLLLVLFRSRLGERRGLVVLLDMAKHLSSRGVLLDLAKLVHYLRVGRVVEGLRVHASRGWSAVVATNDYIGRRGHVKVLQDDLSVRRTCLHPCLSAFVASALHLRYGHVFRCCSVRA